MKACSKHKTYSKRAALTAFKALTQAYTSQEISCEATHFGFQGFAIMKYHDSYMKLFVECLDECLFCESELRVYTLEFYFYLEAAGTSDNTQCALSKDFFDGVPRLFKGRWQKTHFSNDEETISLGAVLYLPVSPRDIDRLTSLVDDIMAKYNLAPCGNYERRVEQALAECNQKIDSTNVF